MDIKIVAFICMILDHVAAAFLAPGSLYYALRSAGRLAFPLFVWGIVRGFCYTSNVRRYIGRVFLLGVVSQIPFVLVFRLHKLNVLFELCGILLVLAGIQHQSVKRCAGLAAGLLLCGVSEYGYRGLAYAVVLYLLRDRQRLMFPISFAFAGYLNTGFYRVSALAVPLAAWMERLGCCKKLPRSFYLLYPGHLILIAFIRQVIAT